MNFKERFWELTQERYGRTPDQCDDKQIYEALLLLCRKMAENRTTEEHGRKLYYFSAEFLTGRLLANNLLALGIRDQVEEMLSDMGRELGSIQHMEPEPSLGNGGLGRLAACFLDSIAADRKSVV